MPLYLGNLWDLLLKNPDMHTKERILIQVFEGVRHMHRNQVLHRDLKPDNIFWVSEMPLAVKIGDYGLATSLADHRTLFDTCGTAAYMAPEVSWKVRPQTPALDVFSLGATTFALLEHETVRRGWYTRGTPPEQYNRVFENVINSPPKLFAGLVQSMMAPDPKDRPSLDICIEVVKGQHYDWTKRTRCAPGLAPITAVRHGTQRPSNTAKQQETSLDRAAACGIKNKLSPIALGKQPESRQNPQQALAKYDYKHQQDAMLLQEPRARFPHVTALNAPKLSEPAPVQGVNFQDGLPSYEEATSKNPFARLACSHEIAKRRCRSKLNPPQNIADPVAGQRTKPVTRQSRKSTEKYFSLNGVSPLCATKPAIHPHVSAAHSQRSVSHSSSTTRPRGQHPHNSRQMLRRPRERGQALDIRRTGMGRIRKTTLTGLKAGAIDMGKGLYYLGRGLGAATCNLGCLTAEVIVMLYDMATTKKPASNAGLLLNNDEKRLLVTMRAQALRREAERRLQGERN